MRITEVEEIVMENIDKNIVLKVNLNCCEECPRKLEKALSKLTGVSSLAIDTEENFVSISGTVDSDTLRKLIYVEIGKKAKVVSCDTKSTNNVEEKKPNTKSTGDKDSKNNSNCHHKGKMHKGCCCCCCQDGNCHKKIENNQHKCEAYEGPPEVKDYVCRDYFCKIHPRNRKIIDRVPANESSASMFGYFPNSTQGYYGEPHSWYPLRSSYYPRWYPEQPPTRYGYYQPPRRPQPPYGFY
ncbi:unnamed protein product [Fraxinus pennsylvanica]|uniref:HMA domain-containing protein n=1 Tax=Fraxinus pennsylvanica TaxID=56036 RepID=A0AAD1ZQ42_9LAMI|nr:unnamed protein product [Fraxinus pennsylvanica]